MRKNKKDYNKNKRGKQAQNSIQEHLAKNEEDDKKIMERFYGFDSPETKNITIQYNLLHENKKENHIKHINKFDLDYGDVNDYYIENESKEDSKDSMNEINISEEYLEMNSNTN